MGIDLSLDPVQLMQEATKRDLTADEVSFLKSTHQVSEIVLTISQSGTHIGRVNIRRLMVGQVSRASSGRQQMREIKSRDQVWVDPTSMQGTLPFRLVHHAFERYLERYCANLPLQKGLDMLYQEAKSSVKIRQKSMSGDLLWQGNTGVLFVVKIDTGVKVRTCVTVLPKGSRF